MPLIKESIAAVHRAGLCPVIPFFPFPRRGAKAAGELLIALAGVPGIAALGLIHPGRRVFRDCPGGREPVSEWDLFQFLYSLKYQCGSPLVLAVHFRDIVRFGVIPYARESHRVGLDALLVKDPLPAELDYLATELAGCGVGLGFVAGGPSPDGLGRTMQAFASALIYDPDGILERTGAAGPSRELPVFLPAPPRSITVAGCPGWIMENPLAGRSGHVDWENLDGPAALARLESAVAAIREKG